MLKLSSGFLLRAAASALPRSRCCIPSKLDDLMEEVLGSQNFTTYEGKSDQKGGAAVSVAASSDDTRGWSVINWEKEEKSIKPTPPSPVDIVLVRDKLIYCKRDDQLRLPGSQIAGNKARKMLALNSMADFPTCVVSYGGPQSNAMLALAAVVHFQNEKSRLVKGDPKRKRFVYYTKKLPRFLRNQPSGNFFRALLLGMELIEVSPQDYNDMFGGDFGGSSDPPQSLAPPISGESLWIPQGGAFGGAQAGTRLLAQEILSYWLEYGDKRPLSVFVPGGTCSTAVLLHNFLKMFQAEIALDDRLDIQVVVIPCVGDAGYARRQMIALNTQINVADKNDIPTILPPAPDDSYFGQQAKSQNGYFPFGEPHPAILEVFREMETDNQLVLDLLYGAPSWTVLLRHWRVPPPRVPQFSPESPTAGREIMYVHSGGVEGINSQLLRYKYKGLIDTDDVQFPGRSSGQ
jgi:1-aminocyclopropane-1-carboxylate deaminase